MKTLKLNHTNLRVGDYFGLQEPTRKGKPPEQRICRKVSPLGFLVVGEEVFGEYQFTVDNDKLVVPIAAIQAPVLERITPTPIKVGEDILEAGEYVEDGVIPLEAPETKASKKVKKGLKKQAKAAKKAQNKAAKKQAKVKPKR